MSVLLLHPAALLGLLLAIPVAVLYRRKARMPRRPVAAGRLWAQVLAAHPRRPRWLPWRRAASLAVQWVLVATIVLAVAEPYLRAPQSVVLIIDNSYMTPPAAGVAELEGAKRVAAARVAAMGYRDRAAVVATTGDLRVRCGLTGSRGQLQEAIKSVQPGEGPANLGDAIRLGQKILAREAAEQIVVFSSEHPEQRGAVEYIENDRRDEAAVWSVAAFPPWSVLAVVALAFVVAEWGLYHRRWLE